jgi:ribosomal protein L37AE/L43A
MPHVVERAATGRAKCRGCAAAIAKDTWRIGEAVPNLYADGEGAESRHWYHPRCAAYRRPEAFLQAIEGTDAALDDRDALVAAATEGVTHPRLPRLHRAERATSGRASCRQCRTAIAKDGWRISLLFWEDGRYSPAGFLHPGCVAAYVGTSGIVDRLRYYTPELTDEDASVITAALADGVMPSGPAPPIPPAAG